ncbi:8-demethyl-8-alpha-L-rhamnosyl tetracenomycin-C 2'-O-methyltransferase [Burkholderiales bacterium]|nr:8-demethyl-8-alpha-L-rhamnosyl tetracenomycin-C 2'-O-methyltransferase [Burkholderiales bacterium]
MTFPEFDRLPWDGPDRLVFDGVAVEFCAPPLLYERDSVDGRFIVGRTPGMLRALLRELGGRTPARIVDIGVYKGGSMVLLNELFRPEALLGLEINAADIAPLTRYLVERGGGRLRWARGIDQADRKSVHLACDRTFGDAPIDLVIDDASHWYAKTLASFTALFPRLATGGCYVIEDWAWAHWPDPHWQRDFGGPHFADRSPLSNLLVDLMLLVAGAPSAFERVAFDAVAIYVTRGAGELARDFDPFALQHNRGQPIPRFAPSSGARAPVHESPGFVFRGGGR